MALSNFINPSATSSGGATEAKQDTQITHLATIAGDTTDIEAAVELIDDVIYVDDADWTPSTSKHALAGGVYTSTPRAVTDGDTGPLSIDVNGHLINNPHAASVGFADDVSNTQKINVDHTGALVASPSFGFAYDGTTWDRMRGTSADGLLVNLGTNNDVTVTGTVDLGATDNAVLDAIAASVAAIDTDTTTLIGHVDDIETLIGTTNTNTGNAATSLGVMDDWDNAASNGARVSGDVAHDSVDAGEPIKVGGVAYESDGTAPQTAVAEGDRVNGIFSRDGMQFVHTFHPRLFSATENHSSAQTNNELVAAPGANLSLYITDIIVSNGATAGDIKFVRDTAGTPTDVIENLYLAINGGATVNLRTPLRITTNQNFGFTSTTVTTHSIFVSGFIAP